MTNLESKREIKIKEWKLKELNNALRYYQSVGWCKATGDDLVDYRSLRVAMIDVENNMEEVLDGFMKDKRLLAFLLVHSVFDITARSGEFIEYYMAARIQITDRQLHHAFNKPIPSDVSEAIKKMTNAGLDPEIEPFEVYPYRVEFGCRKERDGEIEYHHDPIRVIDLIWDEQLQSISQKEFISQFEDLVL